MWGRIIFDEEETKGWLIIDPLEIDSKLPDRPVTHHRVRLIESGLTIEIHWDSTEPECSDPIIPDRICRDGRGHDVWDKGTILFKNWEGYAYGDFCRRKPSKEEEDIFEVEKRNAPAAPAAEAERSDDSTEKWIDQYTGDFDQGKYLDDGTWTRRCLQMYTSTRKSGFSVIDWKDGEKWKLKLPPVKPESPVWKRPPDRIYVSPNDPEVSDTPIDIELGYWVDEKEDVEVDGQFKEVSRKVLIRQRCEMFRLAGQAIDSENTKSIPTLPAKEYVTIQEAAEYAKVTEKTIRNWIQKANMITFKGTGKLTRILRSSLDDYVKPKKQTRKPNPPKMKAQT